MDQMPRSPNKLWLVSKNGLIGLKKNPRTTRYLHSPPRRTFSEAFETSFRRQVRSNQGCLNHTSTRLWSGRVPGVWAPAGDPSNERRRTRRPAFAVQEALGLSGHSPSAAAN